MKRVSGAIFFGPARHSAAVPTRLLASVAAETCASSSARVQLSLGTSPALFCARPGALSRSSRTLATGMPQTSRLTSVSFTPARIFAGLSSASYPEPSSISSIPISAASPARASASNAPPVDDALSNSELSAEDVESLLRDVIEQKIAPTVRDDGGDISLHSWDHASGRVTVALTGACASCDRSTITMRFLVERALKFYVPEVRSVARADPAAAGAGAEEAEGGWGCAPPVEQVQAQQQQPMQMQQLG